MSVTEPNPAPTPKSRKTGRRVAVVGTIAGLALIGGAGAAYAASQQAPVESGYSTVVDEATGRADAQAKGDCPDRTGNSNGSGSSGESAAPSSPQQSAPSSADPTPGEI